MSGGWRTTGEVAPWFGYSEDWVRGMLADPAHADFAARVVRRGTHRQFPASLTWFYANEGRMPADRADLLDFVERCPVPESDRNEARLVQS